MSAAELSKYPDVYTKIVLTTPGDGTPLDIPVSSEEAAKQERLRFYNFLKFCRRNPRKCAHLHADNRVNRISVSVQGSVLSFTIKGANISDLEKGFNNVAGSTPLASGPITLPFVPDNSSQIETELHIPGLDDDEPKNPLATLNSFLEKKS